MRVAMLTTSYPKHVGDPTAPFIEEIAAALVRRGHEVHVVAPYHRELRRAAVERGVHLHFFRYAPLPALSVWGYAESLRADVSLRRNTLLAAPWALSAGALQLRRLLTRERFDLVHAHWVLPNAAPALLAARLSQLPLLISLHGSDVFLAEQTPALTWAAGGLLRAAARITACSRDLAARAVRLGAPAARLDVIPYGVDPAQFRPDQAATPAVRAALHVPAGAPLVLTMSRLVYKKGLTYLLDAWPTVLARHPAAVLAICGYGDLRADLEQQAQRLGVAASVRFPGQIDRELTSGYIAAADLYAVPAIRDDQGNIDGLPNALLEGMAAGRPIVASAVAGIPDVLTDGVSAALVPERDTAALAAAVNRLLAEPTLAARLGAAARERITTGLTWDATAELWEASYRRALKG